MELNPISQESDDDNRSSNNKSLPLRSLFEFKSPFAKPIEKRSEPDERRVVTPPEVVLPTVAELPQPVHVTEQPPAWAAEQAFRTQERNEDDDEEDEEEVPSSRPLPIARPAALAVDAALEAAAIRRAVPQAEFAVYYPPEQTAEDPPEPVAPTTRHTQSMPPTNTPNQAPIAPVIDPNQLYNQAPQPVQPNVQPAPNPNRGYYYGALSHNANPQPAYGTQEHLFYLEAQQQRRKMAAANLTGLLALWWVHHLSKRRDKQLAHELGTSQQHVAALREQQTIDRAHNTEEQDRLRRTIEQQRANQVGEMPAHDHQEVSQPYLEQLFGQAEQQPLTPEDHVGHSQWHRYVERDGRAVEDAVTYGEAYRQERRAEHMPAAFGSQDAGFQSGSDGAPGNGGWAGGQTPFDHSLPEGQTADAQHVLPAKNSRNPVVAAVTSPWVWLAVGIVFIAFFIATTV